MNKLNKYLIIYFCAVCNSSFVLANEQDSVGLTENQVNNSKELNHSDEGSNTTWSGTVEYGIIATTGNTNTRSENGKFLIQYERSLWFNKFTTTYLKSSDSDVVSADQSLISNYTKYNFKNKNFIFISLKYERDSFSGFLLRVTKSIGYGFALYNNKDFNWNIELGIGERQTQRSDSLGKVENDTIVRLATDMKWDINKTSRLTESLQVEQGKINTYSESETVLKFKLNDILSIKFNLKIKYNSNVPTTSKNTDSQRTVNIVYDF